MRNPFTSVSNISFLRNTSRMTSQTKDSYVPRSLSSHKYFDYQPSYMHDSYLLGYDSRKQQENQYCRVMGLEAMRYKPDPPPIDNEYYAIQIHQMVPLEEESKPLDNCPTDANTNTVSSAMKNTKDMFGSDYFTNRMDSSEADEIAPKKSAIKRKNTNSSSKIRFKKVIEINCPQLSEESSQLQDSMYDESANKVDENLSKTLEEDPKTIYLKCKKRIFYLYEKDYALI